MNIRRPRRAAIESSALSDMAFLLIIYFIVIAGFNLNRGFLLALPQKDSVRMVRKDELLRFRLDGEGTIVFEDAATDQSRAERRIQAAVAANPNLAVALVVAPGTPWQSVVTFVSLVQKAGVSSFSFSMERAGEGE
ncbi:MAG: biopolymer transporter ExbD [Treponema sp.]|jgi:biopolymer transport protein ExbD|nr:biopolymer transporter ExbD [Treponema sp.]